MRWVRPIEWVLMFGTKLMMTSRSGYVVTRSNEAKERIGELVMEYGNETAKAS